MAKTWMAGLLIAGWGATAGAAPILPDSYDMLNGTSGAFNYWDETYTGSGCVTCDADPLTGGKGDLTDGIIASDNWFVVEAPAGNGPYVGWQLDPTITFHFGGPVSIDSVTLYLDDSDGNGGVNAPFSVTIGGSVFLVPEPAGSAPFSFTASGLSFAGTDLSVTLTRKSPWVFLSEVTFDDGAATVPEPGTAALLLTGLGALATFGRRRRA